MHSIIDISGNCIGQYIFIKDDKYTTRLFARFYNMCMTNNKEIAPITEYDVQDFIKMKKYHLENTILAYDLLSDTFALKHLKVGSVMVYTYNGNKLYITSETELNTFLEKNNYKTLLSTNYVLGIPRGDKFIKVRPIASNNVDNAKQIYKKRYNVEEDPVVVGVKAYGSLHIDLNDHVLVADVDENTIIK